MAKVKPIIGTIIEFICFNKRYALSIKEISKYKNYSWFGDLGVIDNISFFVHGNLDDNNEPILDGLAIQYDVIGELHGYVRSGISYIK